MILRGSMTEMEFRKRFISSRNRMLSKNASPSPIISILKNEFSEILSAFVLGYIPEQREDIYDVLVNGTHVVSFEVPKDGREGFITNILTVKDYEKNLRHRADRIQLAVALDLAKSDKH